MEGKLQTVALMRCDSALTLSLVAEIDGESVGHISFSKVAINGEFYDFIVCGKSTVLYHYQLRFHYILLSK